MIRSFELCKNEYVYETLPSNNGSKEPRGIKVYKKDSLSCADSSDVCIIEDISTDGLFIDRLIDYLCHMKVLPVHVKDIVEDILQMSEFDFH